jgi:hypothetical protein
MHLRYFTYDTHAQFKTKLVPLEPIHFTQGTGEQLDDSIQTQRAAALLQEDLLLEDDG